MQRLTRHFSESFSNIFNSRVYNNAVKRASIPTPESRRLGANIKERREALGLTLEQLVLFASRDGRPLKKSWLSRLERGLIPTPGAQPLAQLAGYFRCSVEDLLSRPTGQRATIEVPSDRLLAIRQFVANLPAEWMENIKGVVQGLGYFTHDITLREAPSTAEQVQQSRDGGSGPGAQQIGDQQQREDARAALPCHG